MSGRAKAALRVVGSGLRDFISFFGMIAFVVTCSFLLFFSSITLTEEDIRTFAPAVFFNVFFLAVLFTVFDALRRRLTVDRPAKQIQQTLQRLMTGDFQARLTLSRRFSRGTRFADIADSVNLLAEELASVETLRTDFIANVSHELKTPLAVMQNYALMLQQPGLTQAQRLEYAVAIDGGARRLAALITNILKLNKLENQQIFPTAARYDLSEQLRECLLQFEDVWEEKGLSLDLELGDGVMIVSDPELLSLVWNNLISNAVKFTPPGGCIAVRLHADADTATVIVADTGCGMSPDVGAHIFEKFYQGDPSHAAQGNGLGLALVRRVVDIVRGEVGVESAVGVGSTFTVRIRRNCHG